MVSLYSGSPTSLPLPGASTKAVRGKMTAELRSSAMSSRLLMDFLSEAASILRLSPIHRVAQANQLTYVSNGSWLCENAKALNRNRRSYSSKTVPGVQFENTFDLEIELKNVILVAFRFFAFLHNQGHSRPKSTIQVTSAYPLRAEVQRTSLMVRFVPTRDSCTAANGIVIRSPCPRVVGAIQESRGRACSRS